MAFRVEANSFSDAATDFSEHHVSDRDVVKTVERRDSVGITTDLKPWENDNTDHDDQMGEEGNLGKRQPLQISNQVVQLAQQKPGPREVWSTVPGSVGVAEVSTTLVQGLHDCNGVQALNDVQKTCLRFHLSPMKKSCTSVGLKRQTSREAAIQTDLDERVVLEQSLCVDRRASKPWYKVFGEDVTLEMLTKEPHNPPSSLCSPADTQVPQQQS